MEGGFGMWNRAAGAAGHGTLAGEASMGASGQTPKPVRALLGPGQSVPTQNFKKRLGQEDKNTRYGGKNPPVGVTVWAGH